MIDVIFGLQWGDEGKGKIVDKFASNYDIVARFQGGPNAGHTLYFNDQKIVLHQIPSGVFYEKCMNVIGNGVVLDPITFKKEYEKLINVGIDPISRILISERTNIIIPTHRSLDKASEAYKKQNKIGSTLRGIGPAYMDKTGRNAIRLIDVLEPGFMKIYNDLKDKHKKLLENFNFNEEIAPDESLFFESIDFIRKFKIVSLEYYLNDQIVQGKKILAEGAQGVMLDVDFGTFPYVTSSNTVTGGVCTGLGVSPHKIRDVYGVTKSYCTRVGGGPFPTELLDEEGDKIRRIGNEFGATTGRPRRCGWIDLVALRFACMLNGVTKVVMTKTDILDQFQSLSVCSTYMKEGAIVNQVPSSCYQYDNLRPHYLKLQGWNTDSSVFKNQADFPDALITYITMIQQQIGVPICCISNGPNREQLINVDLK